MTIRMAGMIAVGMCLMAGAATRAKAADPDRFDRIERRQQALIRHDYKARELTGQEVRHLEGQQARIHRQEERAEANGFSPQERRHLTKELVRSRRDIYRAAHN